MKKLTHFFQNLYYFVKNIIPSFQRQRQTKQMMQEFGEAMGGSKGSAASSEPAQFQYAGGGKIIDRSNLLMATTKNPKNTKKEENSFFEGFEHETFTK